MSSLEQTLFQRNADAMMANLRTVNGKLEANTKLIQAQSAKIATMALEIQTLKQSVSMLQAGAAR